MRAGIKLDRTLHLQLFDEKIDLPPRYSKDWASCGRIIGALVERSGFEEFIIAEVEDFDDDANSVFYWSVKFSFTLEHMDYTFKGEAPDIPLAVCRAALEYMSFK